MDSEKTIMFSVRLSKQDYDNLSALADERDMDVSVLVRQILAQRIPSFSGNVNQHGGARKGAGRPRTRQHQPA